MKGWFDAFRYNGGPTLYNFNNRTAVSGDVTLITILTIFGTLYLAFLIIFPGVRKERFSTFYAVTLSLFVGATILISLFGSAWHISSSTINATFTAFSEEKIYANVGIFVGLSHINITLQAVSTNLSRDFDFNEQFLWLSIEHMKESYHEAVERGLPYPILTVAEYFTTGTEGLSWGCQYRTAGYFANIMLRCSLVFWLMMNLMLVVVPRYGALLMTVCGLLLLATTCGYFACLPEVSLVIHLENAVLDFYFGWCFWLLMAAGILCLLSGVIITAIEILMPHSFSTILEVDYDTPYDRHIIIEDSRGKRLQRNNFLDANHQTAGERISFGAKFLRRLSSKSSVVRTAGRHNGQADAEEPSIYLTERNIHQIHSSGNDLYHSQWKCPLVAPNNTDGVSNYAYEPESMSSFSTVVSSSNSGPVDSSYDD